MYSDGGGKNPGNGLCISVSIVTGCARTGCIGGYTVTDSPDIGICALRWTGSAQGSIEFSSTFSSDGSCWSGLHISSPVMHL